ncbi:11178_t:CDS:1, partial [Racocetra persica]
DLEEDSIEVEQKEIIQSIQDISFQESLSTDKENLTKNFELLPQVKLFSKEESEVWKFVDKQTRKCSQYSKIFKPTTSTTSIRNHLQHLHKFLLDQEKLNLGLKKHSAAIQAEKT